VRVEVGNTDNGKRPGKHGAQHMAEETPEDRTTTQAESSEQAAEPPAAPATAVAVPSEAGVSPDAAAPPDAAGSAAEPDTARPEPAVFAPLGSTRAAAIAVGGFGRWGLISTAAAALVAVVASTCAVFFGVKYYHQKQVDDARSAGRQFVCSFAKSLVSYDFNNLDQFFRNVLDETTGPLQADFQGTKAQDLKQRVVNSQTKSTANEANCGLLSGDDRKVVAVVTLTQNVTSANTQGQSVVMPPAVMMITATQTDGRWRASDLAPIGLQQ
jgi:Mce-associated membrane protein